MQGRILLEAWHRCEFDLQPCTWGGRLGERGEAALLLTVLWESPVERGSFYLWKQCQKGARCALGNTCITISLNCLLEVVLVGGYVKAETFKNAEQYAHNTQSWFGRVVPWLSSVYPDGWESSSRSCVSVMWNPVLLPLYGSECQLGFLICCHWHSLPTLLQMNHPKLYFSCLRLPDLISVPDTTCSSPLKLTFPPICP